MEQFDNNLLFRWFVGLAMDAGVGSEHLQQGARPAAGKRRRAAAACGGERSQKSRHSTFSSLLDMLLRGLRRSFECGEI